MTTAAPTPYPDGELYDAAAALYVERAELELNTVGSILADPLAGIERASRCGLRAHHIQEPDLQIVALAVLVKVRLGKLTGDRHADQLAVLRLARHALREQHYWDDGDQRRFVSGSRWSDASLAALADLFPSTCAVPSYVGRLIVLHDRLARAARLLAQLRAVLLDEPAGQVEAMEPESSNGDGESSMERAA